MTGKCILGSCWPPSVPRLLQKGTHRPETNSHGLIDYVCVYDYEGLAELLGPGWAWVQVLPVQLAHLPCELLCASLASYL